MARRGGLSLGMRQRAGLMPALAESLAMLRMPLADLAEFLSREAEENPLLDYRPPVLHTGGIGGSDSSALAAPESRGAVLRRQIAEQRLAPDVRAVADYLTEELTDEGFLAAPCDEIAARLGLPEELIAAGLAALQRCEPTGIGARDLGECLRLQLAEAGVAPAVAAALTAHLPDAARQDWRAIARASGLSSDEIAAAGARLAGLSPRPMPPEVPAPAVLMPEIVVRVGPRGGLAVHLADDMLPGLGLAEAPRRVSPEARRYLAERRARARQLLGAMAYRRRTLLRVARALVARQHAFFTGGAGDLRPLTRAALAEELGLHVSTVGRALAGKSVASPQGTHPASLFFPAGVGCGDGGAMSAPAVKRHIRQMIAAEPEQAPLSDAAITAELQRMGVDIARRTVAKYRECMTIPPSFRRRGVQRRT